MFRNIVIFFRQNISVHLPTFEANFITSVSETLVIMAY